MLSISGMGNGQEEYYLGLAREDYYMQGGEPPGLWTGNGAEALGLRGQIEAGQLRHLFGGFAADGRELIQNAGSSRHQPGWDLTFSTPKSVSVLWGLGSRSIREEIQEAHAAAVKAALGYLQDAAGFTRRGKDGVTVEPAGLVIATFEHGTSRALDPQLHTHSLVMNVGTRADGGTGTIVSKSFYEHKMAAGAVYRAELAYLLEKQLGFVCERDKSCFRVTGVPESVTDWFSKRRAAIEERLGGEGLESARAAAFATLATRKEKDLVPPRPELFATWRKDGQEQSFTQAEAEALRRKPPERDQAKEAAGVFREVVEKLTSSQSHFSEKDLVRYTAEAAQGRGVGADLVRRQVREGLRQGGDIVRLGKTKGEERYTTREMLRLEKSLLKTAERLKGDLSHQVRDSTMNKVFKKLPTLTAEQRAAVLRATRGCDGVQVISGMAGTGKTYMLDACRQAWEKDGYRVVGAALSGKAARELENGAHIGSDTLAKRLWDLEHGGIGDRLRHDAKQLTRAAMGKGTRKFERFRIDKRTIVVVDEAGMVGTRQMEQLIKAVERGGGKLVLVGDAKQLQPIEAGGAFQALGKRLGQVELTNITRQRDEWAREAVQDFARGDSSKALKRFAERGLLSVAKNRDAAIKNLVSDWAKRGLQNPQENLIFAGTNLEATKINRLCQAARLERDGTTFKSKVKVGSEVIYARDRVLCTQKSRLFGVENGDIGTVVKVNAARRTVTVKLDDGREATLPLREYEGLRLGYAVTTHKGQGATVEKAYVLVGGSMQDREISYVQASRARSETRLYTDELEAGEDLRGLVRQMRGSRAKDLAHDAATQQVSPPALPPERMP